jgi:hypothetical protein
MSHSSQQNGGQQRHFLSKDEKIAILYYQNRCLDFSGRW